MRINEPVFTTTCLYISTRPLVLTVRAPAACHLNLKMRPLQTAEDDFVHIKGTGRQSYDKGLRVRVNAGNEAGNNYNIEVGNGSNLNIEVNGGNINLTTLQTGADGGDININASRKLNIQASTGIDFNTFSGDININKDATPGKVNIKGTEINLN